MSLVWPRHNTTSIQSFCRGPRIAFKIIPKIDLTSLSCDSITFSRQMMLGEQDEVRAYPANRSSVWCAGKREKGPRGHYMYQPLVLRYGVDTGKFFARLPGPKLEKVIVLTGRMLQRISASLRDLKPGDFYLSALSLRLLARGGYL